MYSPQTQRFTIEQLALEQARMLKRMSNVKSHRVERPYFVCGARKPISHRYEVDGDQFNTLLQITDGKVPIRDKFHHLRSTSLVHGSTSAKSITFRTYKENKMCQTTESLHQMSDTSKDTRGRHVGKERATPEETPSHPPPTPADGVRPDEEGETEKDKATEKERVAEQQAITQGVCGIVKWYVLSVAG